METERTVCIYRRCRRCFCHQTWHCNITIPNLSNERHEKRTFRSSNWCCFFFGPSHRHHRRLLLAVAVSQLKNARRVYTQMRAMYHRCRRCRWAHSLTHTNTCSRIDLPLVIAFLFDYVTFWWYYAFRLTFNGPVAMQLTMCFHIE